MNNLSALLPRILIATVMLVLTAIFTASLLLAGVVAATVGGAWLLLANRGAGARLLWHTWRARRAQTVGGASGASRASAASPVRRPGSLAARPRGDVEDAVEAPVRPVSRPPQA